MSLLPQPGKFLLAGFLLCGLGLLIALPVVMASTAYAYDDLVGISRELSPSTLHVVINDLSAYASIPVGINNNVKNVDIVKIVL